MKFSELLTLVGDEPLFRGSFLLAGDRDSSDVRRQLSRWTAAGKIVQLRRNLYALSPPWRRMEPHPFVVAKELHAPSYVSLQSALAHHGMIPEAVPMTTSVTTARPQTFQTPFGRYAYRHVRREAFFGYHRIAVYQDQRALVADPEKALLDLAYLTPGGARMEHLESLRLDGLEALDPDRLLDHARRWGKPEILRTAENLLRLRSRGQGGEGES